MKKKVFIALGLMSGTSMDGVDMSLISSDGFNEFTSILNKYHKFDPELQNKLMDLRYKIKSSGDLKKYSSEINILEREITLFHHKLINKVLSESNQKIDLIGFHGQTIFHNSEEKISKQLGDGRLLSQLTKKLVINNFREEDLKKDGQGAPLTPIFHKLISNIINIKFDISFPFNIINIGGITNITQVLDNYSNNINLYAYDIAPGNCLIDEWVRKKSKKKFDEDGSLAKSGKVNDLLYNQAIDNFYINNYEKSLDIKDFDISFVRGLSLEDGCATLTKFSAHLISKGIEDINNQRKKSSPINLVCGGGRKNNFLIQQINENLKHKYLELENIDNYGFDGDFIESQAFGYLSIRTYLNLPISFPNTTRCKSETIGGIINKNF
tara:strand:- start:666 stop:1811 length:1146 start_codon:yes stop_codon:yes gene_type:complete